MITYCTDCGKKIEHKALEKPNFCPKCGFSFLKGGATPLPSKKPIIDEMVDDLHDEFEMGRVEVNLTELDFDIEYEPTVKKETLGGVIEGASGNTAPTSRKKLKRKRTSKKQRKENARKGLEGFKKEAGTSRETKG